MFFSQRLLLNCYINYNILYRFIILVFLILEKQFIHLFIQILLIKDKCTKTRICDVCRLSCSGQQGCHWVRLMVVCTSSTTGWFWSLPLIWRWKLWLERLFTAIPKKMTRSSQVIPKYRWTSNVSLVLAFFIINVS